MSWFELRSELEAITHEEFGEPATYTPPESGNAVEVEGVLTQRSQTAELDRTGYEQTDDTYKLRKASRSPPWSATDFAEQGQLRLASGQLFTVMSVIQTDTLIILGLAAHE